MDEPHPGQGLPARAQVRGPRALRDYKVAAGAGSSLGTASPFNIKVRSLTLRNFTAEAVSELYQQHTANTGQRFEPEALALAFGLTQGQPWLASALAKVAVEELVPGTSRPVHREDIEQAGRRSSLRPNSYIASSWEGGLNWRVSPENCTASPTARRVGLGVPFSSPPFLQQHATLKVSEA